MTRRSRVGGKCEKQPMGKRSGGNRVRGKRQKLKPEAERKVGGESSGGGSSWGKNKRVFPPPPAEKTSLPPRLGLKESGTYEEFIRNALARTRARRCNPYIGFEPFGNEKMADESTIERYLEQVEESDGFDIDVFPGGRETIYAPIRNFKNDPQLYKDLVEMAIMALEEFNDKNKDTKGVPFGFKDIEKVISYMCAGEVFHITFQAEEAETAEVKTFQAKVYEPIQEDQREVMLVRLKKY
ncbi:uncharacterized protein [Coffea arabica]|uniref:Uncharacterized protein n=1 Tax=Coffea arabica TaxID=13443 RepID=A0A6P6WD46_COFAR|nr:uncharacterized protein LOC113731979 [Coffea arabica]